MNNLKLFIIILTLVFAVPKAKAWEDFHQFTQDEITSMEWLENKEPEGPLIDFNLMTFSWEGFYWPQYSFRVLAYGRYEKSPSDDIELLTMSVLDCSKDASNYMTLEYTENEDETGYLSWFSTVPDFTFFKQFHGDAFMEDFDYVKIKNVSDTMRTSHYFNPSGKIKIKFYSTSSDESDGSYYFIITFDNGDYFVVRSIYLGKPLW